MARKEEHQAGRVDKGGQPGGWGERKGERGVKLLRDKQRNKLGRAKGTGRKEGGAPLSSLSILFSSFLNWMPKLNTYMRVASPTCYVGVKSFAGSHSDAVCYLVMLVWRFSLFWSW
jgi:hypothetical protein